MAFDTYLVERIHEVLDRKRIAHSQKAMMGGLAIMVDEKMLCGITKADEHGQSRLMARVGAERASNLLDHKDVEEWDLSRSRMKDYVLVGAVGVDADADLERWLDECIAFNPLAKRSKRRSS